MLRIISLGLPVHRNAMKVGLPKCNAGMEAPLA